MTAMGKAGWAIIAAVMLAAGGALAQPLPAASANEPDTKAPCAVPGATIANSAPLPHLAGVLKAKKTVRVLAIGSSSTSGIGATSPSATYPSQLEVELEKTFKDLDFVMVNRGIPGEIAETTSERLKIEVTLTKPDLVLWQVGTNDALSRIPVGEFARVISRTLRWVKAQKIDVVVVGMQYTKRLARDEHYKMIKDALRQAATEADVPLINRYDAMQYILQSKENTNLLAGDDFHLNDLGYRCMAEHVARGILVSVFATGSMQGIPLGAPPK